LYGSLFEVESISVHQHVISFNPSIKSINLLVGLAFLEVPVIYLYWFEYPWSFIYIYIYTYNFLRLEGWNRYMELERTVVVLDVCIRN
jgi:hypothetical protein